MLYISIGFDKYLDLYIQPPLQNSLLVVNSPTTQSLASIDQFSSLITFHFSGLFFYINIGISLSTFSLKLFL